MTTGSVEAVHTAVGSMAGYIFQPDRALVILCSCTSKQSVSIELFDDVAVADETGVVAQREQTKNTIQEETSTFGDRSKDLWNTLSIWCSAIKSGELDIATTKLVCVTNAELDPSSLVMKIAAAKDRKTILEVLDLLKKAVASPPLGIKNIIDKVLGDEENLKKVIAQIHVVYSNTLERRNEEIAEKLHLPENIKANVMETMRGWFHESVLNQLDQGKAPVIAKKNFNEKLAKVIKKETDDRIVFLAKAYVKGQIAKEKVDEAVDRNFVRQLDVINHVDKHNIILDAIYDFLCSETERTRLTKRGDLTRQELEAIDEASKERWKEVFRRNVRQHTTSMSEGELADMAFSIYSSTIENYFSKIRGFDTEKYFTNGSFHRLSEDLEIGWHPNWESLFPNK